MTTVSCPLPILLLTADTALISSIVPTVTKISMKARLCCRTPGGEEEGGVLGSEWRGQVNLEWIPISSRP